MWQPIETAPKDRSILLWPCGYASTHLEIAFWDTHEEYSEWRREVVSLYEGWVRDDEDQMPIHAPVPITHWMPLPDPPAVETPKTEAVQEVVIEHTWDSGGPTLWQKFHDTMQLFADADRVKVTVTKMQEEGSK